jgi:hypothetical protein
MYGANMSYIVLVVVSLVLGGLTQAYIKKTYAKWSKVAMPAGQTGSSVARALLAANGVTGVDVVPSQGELSDHFDPRDNALHLSPESMSGTSVASVAVACHEAGHAVQHAKGYVPGKIRSSLVPVVNFASQVWIIVFMLGVFMTSFGLIQAAIVLFSFSVLFQLVTLPVEFNASRRAVAYLETAGYDATTLAGAKQVLTAAALTYVAAALVSCLQLLYLLGQNRRDS